MAKRKNVERERQSIRTFSPSKQIAGLILVIVFLALIVWLVNTPNRSPQATDAGIVPRVLCGIDIDGVGGDPLLNRMKNRFTAPTTFDDLNVTQVIAIPNTVLATEGARHRDRWSSPALSYLQAQEARGVRVTGYIINAKESGVEACNGKIDSLRDYHIWISDDSTGVKAGSMVVEVTPRWKIAHPEWRLRFFKALAKQHARVRVSGWLLWDEEHGAEVDKSRATLWEVHPITKFEVWSGNTWQGLASDSTEYSLP